MDFKSKVCAAHTVDGKGGKCYWLRASKMAAAPGWKVGRVEGESA